MQMNPRNVLTNLEETLLAMSAVEDRSGTRWLQRQHQALDLLENVEISELTGDPDDIDEDTQSRIGYTVAAALVECYGRSVKPDYISEKEWEEMREGIATIVYGDGGWNRWGVKYTGEVLFSRYHEREGDTKLAESLGFKIY